MRDLLDKYIRSLREQSQARDAPEYQQDLGTLVDWLLERHGYQTLEHTFRHSDGARIKATGERQWGADILAIKPDRDGTLRGYRFVLKQGDMGAAQFKMEDGFLPDDLWLAAGRDPSEFAKYRIDEKVSRWTVVAVHNGDVRITQIGDQRSSLIRRIQEVYGCDVDWWDAPRLVNLVLEAQTESGAPLTERASAGLFPPGVRPFARLAIDSLAHGHFGARFDLDAVDRLVDSVLPIVDGAQDLRDWERTVSELGLLVAMIDVECKARPEAKGTTLPGFEAAERVLCRAMGRGGAIDDLPKSSVKKRVTELLVLLLRQYVALGERLVEHLTPVLGVMRGLALPVNSEPIDYPLRTLRLAGYVAAAGAVARDLGNVDLARRFASVLKDIFHNNPGGALSPVTDDQVVELALCWDLWRSLGDPEEARSSARSLVERLLWRRSSRRRLPALYLEAGVPIDDRALRILVKAAFARGRVSGYADDGSLTLALAIYLGWATTPGEEADAVIEVVAGEVSGEGPTSSSSRIHVQCWLPSDKDPLAWYHKKLADTGTSHVLRLEGGFVGFVREFERFNRALTVPSSAHALGLGAIDRIAWKRFRNPPPLAIFVDSRSPSAAQAAQPGSTAP
jgi:hypothetical protein